MIRWLFAFWTDRPLRPRELPGIFARVLLFGAIAGVLLSLGAHLVLWHPLPLNRVPVLAGYAAAMGAIFALSFYATCGVPQGWLKEKLRDLPVGVRRNTQIAAGVIGASAGFTVAFLAASGLPGVKMKAGPGLGWLIAAEGVVGGIIAAIVFAFRLGGEHARRTADALLKARLSALQAQIQPHFFFNALNTVSGLIATQPKVAQELIGDLANLFRYSLDSSCTDVVALDDELGFIANYLRLEAARFGDRLRVEFPAGRYPGIRLPGLLLQPLVENAVRHGIARRVEGGLISIMVERNGVQCRLTVRNQYDPDAAPDLAPSRLYRTGHALDNIRQRLALYAGARASLQFEREPGDWIRAVIEVPVEP